VILCLSPHVQIIQLKLYYRRLWFLSWFSRQRVASNNRIYWKRGSYWLSLAHNFKSFTVAIMTCLTGADSRCYNKWSRILGVTTNDHGYVPFVVITIPPFPHSWFITGFVTRVTRRIPQWSRNCLPVWSTWVHPRFSGVHDALPLVFCVVLCRPLFLVYFYLLAIVVSVFQMTDSNYHFGIFTLYLALLVPDS
jgi:hypothetical protein